jgi:hypothetical protein
MIFERDLFISYASIDNMPIKEGEKGWVENFHIALEIRLSQLMETRPQIWRQSKLSGSGAISDQIPELLFKTALMLPILSPRYISSECCSRELKEFCEKSDCGAIAGKIGVKSRIFKLLKTALAYNDHPREIADKLGYEFYHLDAATGMMKELSQSSMGELEQIYWARLDDLAHDICDVLERIKNIDAANITAPQERLNVYLAETSREMKNRRDLVKRELLEAGCDILPDYRLPSTAAEFQEAAEALLEQCDLSIHLVGGSYGPAPTDTPKSIVELQNEIAVKKSKTGKLARLIWLSPEENNGSPTDERQKQFIYMLRTNAEAQFGADLLETPLKDLEYAVADKLKKIRENLLKQGTTKDSAGKESINLVEQKISTPAASEDRKTAAKKESNSQIYLICDRRDLDNIGELEKYFYYNEFDVVIPAFEGEEAALMIDHRENLKSCDAAVIFFGAGSDLWLRSITRDIQKIAGYGRAKPLTAKAIYVAPPVTPAKGHLLYHDWHIIEGAAGFSAESVTPFLEVVKKMSGD